MPRQLQPEEQGNLEPITHKLGIDTGFLDYQEHRFFDPDLNYEVVKVQMATKPSANTTFHTLTFPIDQLDERLMTKATQLLNLRSITFHNPLSWEVFIANYMSITLMALQILTDVPSLTSITFCADVLNETLFLALATQTYLREVEILLPTISFSIPNRLAHIGEELNKGIARLQQVEYFNIPLELVTPALLSCLGRLPHLSCLKTTGSADTLYPGRVFIGNMEHMQNPGFFGRLQVLDVRDNLSQEDSLSKYSLNKIFPNTKFVST